MYLVIELMQEAERSKVRRAAFKHHHLVLATLFCNLSRTSVTLQAEKVVVRITTGAASCGKMLHQVDLLSFYRDVATTCNKGCKISTYSLLFSALLF